jgi:putative radical SAM enzyme (TIGR03279 family)
MKKQIIRVEKNSIACELGIEGGDFLISINDKPVIDIFDYRLAEKQESLEILIEKTKDNEEWILEIEKDEDEDLGLIFAEGPDGLMDEMRHCGNKCIFCFIDQNAPNMRQSLYFKDDDYRLSFLHGNYITLTNMTEKDINRILQYRISPINISIHATDPDLRIKMMGSPKAGRSLDFLKTLADGGITLALQIVLCKGYNDGENLNKTIYDLSRYLPQGGGGWSLSVVPVGLTKYRKNLTPLEPLNKKDCQAVISQVNHWQEKILKEKQTRFVFAADEFYLKAETELPSHNEYEDFPQIDNGVGMLTSFIHDFKNAPMRTDGRQRLCREGRPYKQITIITGTAAAPTLKSLTKPLTKSLEVNVIPIINEFYGEHITVAGLLTGQDIIKQLKTQDLGDLILLPKSCLKADEDIFLDNITLKEMEQTLNTQVKAINPEGADLIKELLCRPH